MNFYKIYFTLLLIFFTVFNSSAYALNDINAPISTDSRIKTFVYNRNEIFTVVFNYGYHSYIEFAKGENVKVIAMGDSVNWKVKTVDNKLFIMPLEKNGITNMLIETNKGRSYAFDLICRSADNINTKNTNSLSTDYSELRDLTYIVRFYYPKTQEEFDLNGVPLPEISPPSSFRNSEIDNKIIQSNDTRNNYIYNSEGQEGTHIVPTELFDDGYLTYFKFSKKEKVIPKIFTVGKYGKLIPCKMLLFKDYIIIKGVHKKLQLKYKKSGVKIINKSL